MFTLCYNVQTVQDLLYSTVWMSIMGLYKKIICYCYVAWRKSIRRIFNIHSTMHCVLLSEICGDMPVQDQLYARFINFFKGLINSGNTITETCAKLALHGSSSIVSNNISIISSHMAKSRFEITLVNKLHFHCNVTIST